MHDRLKEALSDCKVIFSIEPYLPNSLAELLVVKIVDKETEKELDSYTFNSTVDIKVCKFFCKINSLEIRNFIINALKELGIKYEIEYGVLYISNSEYNKLRAFIKIEG